MSIKLKKDFAVSSTSEILRHGKCLEMQGFALSDGNFKFLAYFGSSEEGAGRELIHGSIFVTEIEKIRIDLDPARKDEMIARTGRRTVPQIFIGDRHVGGCDDLYAVDRAGELTPLLAAG